jgi:VanZ family protein
MKRITRVGNQQTIEEGVAPLNQLRLQTLWFFMGCSLVMLVIFLSLVPNPRPIVSFKGSDKASHFLAYAVTMFWFGLVFGRDWIRIVVALGLLVLGISLEYLQGMSGYRAFEYADMAANSAGILCALLISKTPLSRSLAILEANLFRLTK